MPTAISSPSGANLSYATFHSEKLLLDKPRVARTTLPSAPNGFAATRFRPTDVPANRKSFRFNLITARGDWWAACTLPRVSNLKSSKERG